MQTKKTPGESWSITDVANAAGRSVSSVHVLARRLLPPEMLETRRGRGAAVQLPEPVALALVDVFRLGTLTPTVVDAIKNDPAAVLAAADGLAALARLTAPQETAA